MIKLDIREWFLFEYTCNKGQGQNKMHFSVFITQLRSVRTSVVLQLLPN